MACTSSSSKDFTVRAYPDNFIVKSLEADTDYMWNLKNKFATNYRGIVTSDSVGSIIIPVATPLEKDFFHSFSGEWQLTISSGSGSLTFCGYYNTLLLHFETVDGDSTDAVIDVDCAGEMIPIPIDFIHSLDDIPQGSTHKWLSQDDYTFLQNLKNGNTTTTAYSSAYSSAYKH